MSNRTLSERLAKRFFVTYKQLRLQLRPSAAERTLLFILGCQRSGTSMCQTVFDQDLETTTYPEFSKYSDQDVPKRLRLNPLADVQKSLHQERAPLIAFKPIVESQRALELLDTFDNGHVLWMYRHYKAVAASNLRRFGVENGISDLMPLVNGEWDNWRAQHVPPHVRDIVMAHFSPSMNSYDAAVLFWYVRNSHFFRQALNTHPRVMMVRYEDLIQDPGRSIRAVYERLGCTYPGNHIVASVNTNSLHKGESIELTPAVAALADDMLQQLDNASTDSKLSGDFS